MKPELPDWIIEGMRLTEEHEVLQARARAAWRRHSARDGARLSWQLHQKASEVERLEGRICQTKLGAVIFQKTRVGQGKQAWPCEHISPRTEQR